MTKIKCNISDCAYQGKEVCRASEVKIDFIEGICKSYTTWTELMKAREVDKDKCK